VHVVKQLFVLSPEAM